VPIAIVTGGNSGIGRATAIALAQRGFDVGITWHAHEDRAQEALEEIQGHGVRAKSRQMDLDAGFPDDANAINVLIEELGGIDALVNNAGAGLTSPFLNLDLETWQRTLNLVLSGAFLCAQAAARRMVEQGRGGRIVNVTSVHEYVPLQDSAPYVAAKHGLGGLTKQIAMELAPHGITVNVVSPGWIPTERHKDDPEDAKRAYAAGVPMRRMGVPDDIGAAVAFLASDAANFITGQKLSVNGGNSLE
jgi:NAD(P)-dependent dehydrogenase (short-subunit alcohol dehydrogenase family)